MKDIRMKESTMKELIKTAPYVGFILLIVLMLIFAPLLVIAAVNALFPLAISYGIKQWFAVLVLWFILKFEISFSFK